MYKLQKDSLDNVIVSILRVEDNASIPMNPDNADYQSFKLNLLNQEPGGAVVEDGDSFSLNANPNNSILEDANGVIMTIDQAKEYVRTLP